MRELKSSTSRQRKVDFHHNRHALSLCIAGLTCREVPAELLDEIGIISNQLAFTTGAHPAPMHTPIAYSNRAGKGRDFYPLLVTNADNNMQLVLILPSLGANMASAIAFDGASRPLPAHRTGRAPCSHRCWQVAWTPSFVRRPQQT